MTRLTQAGRARLVRRIDRIVALGDRVAFLTIDAIARHDVAEADRLSQRLRCIRLALEATMREAGIDV